MGPAVRLWMILVLALAAMGPAPALAQQRPVDVWIMQSDPGLTATLGLGDGAYVRLGYRSDRPVRFRMEGYAGGAKLEKGAMYNVAPPYPPGEGEALVWIAFRQATRVDELKITALDGNWRPLLSISTAADLGWTAGFARPKRAEWAGRMSREQQQTATHQVEQSSGDGTLLFFLLVAGVLGYFVLQPLTVLRFDGGWRIAALVPLAATIPLLIHAGIALAAGANLWPILLIFCLPVATLYLLGLAGVRMLATEHSAT